MSDGVERSRRRSFALKPREFAVLGYFQVGFSMVLLARTDNGENSVVGMVLVLDGNQELGAHVRSNLFYL